VEIPRCESCGKIAQYRCAVDGRYVCCECARFVPVTHARNKYLIELPKKIYDFYHMDETDYTIMVSEINPKTIEILF